MLIISKNICNDVIQTKQCVVILHLKFWHGGHRSTTHFVVKHFEIRTLLVVEQLSTQIFSVVDTHESEKLKQNTTQWNCIPSSIKNWWKLTRMYVNSFDVRISGYDALFHRFITYECLMAELEINDSPKNSRPISKNSDIETFHIA